MNDGQADFMAEMKKMQEMMMSTLSLSGRCDNYGMMKEFFALQAEVKQMKEDNEELKEELEDQKDEYEKVCEDQLKMEKELEELKNAYKEVCEKLEAKEQETEFELEKQKNTYKKVCKELTEQQKMQLAANEKTKELELRVANIRSELSGNQKLFCAMLSMMNVLKKQQEQQKDEMKKWKADQVTQQFKKLCDELAELQTEQIQDVTAIRGKTTEMKKKQKAQDLKLQHHDDSIGIRTFIPVKYQIVGKWKMVSSTGREEYEKLMLTYDSHNGDRAKITYESREFTCDRSLISYVDNNMVDPSLNRDYFSAKSGKLFYWHKASTNFSQRISVYIEEQQLVVAATVYKGSKEVAACSCYYNRV